MQVQWLDIPIDGSMVNWECGDVGKVGAHTAPKAGRVDEVNSKSRSHRADGVANNRTNTVADRPKSRKAGEGPQAKPADDQPQEKDPFTRAVDLLAHHPAAKIVVIVDTHCLEESGNFIWKGADTTADFESCCLHEVRTRSPWIAVHPPYHPQLLSTCIPKPFFRFLSDSSDAPNHNHKSIVLNLACGESIRNDEARFHILDG